MSEFGDFLQVLYGPDDRFSSVRATIRIARNKLLANEAGESVRSMGRRRHIAPTPGKPADVEEMNLSVWIKHPDRYRIERDIAPAQSLRPTLTIVNGKKQWEGQQHGRIQLGESLGAPDSDIARHFDPRSLREYFVALVLKEAGIVETAGRHCVRIRATRRPVGQLWPHWLPHGADEYEFHADTERGVLLYVAGRFKGELFESSEVVAAAFDEPLDDALFVHTSMPGEIVLPADPIIERMTLSAAISRMPFTVLVPTRVPDPEHHDFEVMYHPPRPGSQWSHLSLMYRGKARLWIDQSDTAEPDMREELEWETIEHNGKQVSISDPGDDGEMRVLMLEQQGTHVVIWSDLDLETVLGVGTSLVVAK